MKKKHSHSSLYIGLISGTSMDSIDAAIVDIDNRNSKIIGTLSKRYPDTLRDNLLRASRYWKDTNIDQLGQLDRWVGELFRDAALELMEKYDISSHNVIAIGSHGQTIRHQPNSDKPFTMQIGDPNIISSGTKITTVADFRRRDIAVGGEGAPLTPMFHHLLFHSDNARRIVINIGGITNLTILNKNIDETIGFDTGPGNTLIDAWTKKNINQPYDDEGKWASQGTSNTKLLATMLSDQYFNNYYPKSTGFEYFNMNWLEKHLTNKKINPIDIQRTLVCLTAESIKKAIKEFQISVDEAIFCGGGVKNNLLMNEIKSRFKGIKITTTSDYGIDIDFLEAAAFAHLAKTTLSKKTGNIISVTGAKKKEILGGIYLAGNH